MPSDGETRLEDVERGAHGVDWAHNLASRAQFSLRGMSRDPAIDAKLLSQAATRMLFCKDRDNAFVQARRDARPMAGSAELAPAITELGSALEEFLAAPVHGPARWRRLTD